ncbi:MAG: hypothetical protein O2955_21265 [Planctomycetota bacterium]|nr:hypothetical protein [Planctomycetota bacterium]MDA1215039.1 hypothetical protein [Planctomycetota bacterium]
MATFRTLQHGSADEEHLQEYLGQLAMQFRGTRDQAIRRDIADDYSQTVGKLIKRGTWNEMPSLEDQLPQQWMPKHFFEYWSGQTQ